MTNFNWCLRGRLSSFLLSAIIVASGFSANANICSEILNETKFEARVRLYKSWKGGTERAVFHAEKTVMKINGRDYNGFKIRSTVPLDQASEFVNGLAQGLFTSLIAEKRLKLRDVSIGWDGHLYSYNDQRSWVTVAENPYGILDTTPRAVVRLKENEILTATAYVVHSQGNSSGYMATPLKVAFTQDANSLFVYLPKSAGNITAQDAREGIRSLRSTWSSY